MCDIEINYAREPAGNHAWHMPWSRLFRSRWAALFWSAGILWTAYNIADAAPQEATPGNAASIVMTDATGAKVDAADLAALANAMP